MFNTSTKEVRKCFVVQKERLVYTENDKKIIATSNPELWDIVPNMSSSFQTSDGMVNIGVPKLPLSLIEHYAKYQPKEVMVEYGKEPIFNEEGKTVNSKWQLKLTPSGEICWSPVEDFVNEEIGKIPAYGTGLTAEESKQKEVDVEKLAAQYIRNGKDYKAEGFSEYQNGKLNGYIDGYNQALQSNDKMFSLEQVVSAVQKSYGLKYFSENRLIENLKSLTKEQETKK